MKKAIDEPNRTKILIVAGAFFLEVLDATIMILALLPISAELGVPLSAVTLSMASYVLALALFTPISGRIGKNAGLQKKFLFGIVLFCIGSLACAISQDIYQLGFSRMVQGLGSSLVVPSGRSIVLASTSKKRIPATMALLIWPALTAPLLAPLIGAYIVELYDWRYIFYFMLLLAILLLIATTFFLPNTENNPQPIHNIDWVCYGLWTLFTVSLFLVFVAATFQSLRFALSLASLATLTLLMLYQRTLTFPRNGIFTPSLLQFKSFRLNIVSGSLFRISIYAFPVILGIYMMKVASYSPTLVGNCMAFIFLGNLIAKPFAVKALSNNGDNRRYFVVSAFMTSLTLSLFLVKETYDSLAMISLLCFLHGCSRSFQFLGYSSVAFYEVPHNQIFQANTFIASVMHTNALIGQAIPAAVVITLSADNQSTTFLLTGMGTISMLSLITFFTALFISNGPKNPPSNLGTNQ